MATIKVEIDIDLGDVKIVKNTTLTDILGDIDAYIRETLNAISIHNQRYGDKEIDDSDLHGALDLLESIK